MKINIYYGGRGIIDDPTLSVLKVMTNVLGELNVAVEQFNLFEDKNNITPLQGTLKTADGIILASTVEWYGIGGYLMEFLDACWLYGDKDKIASLYMAPVVMSLTYGERDWMTHLESAWEILGGRLATGLCGYIQDTQQLERNGDYRKLIEKATENIYRSISQKYGSLPASNQAVKQKISIPRGANLTPQEGEQLSRYVSDANFVRKQKEDISELTDIFRGMLDKEQKSDDPEELLSRFKAKFRGIQGVRARYRFFLTDKPQMKPLCVSIENGKCECSTETESLADAALTLTLDKLKDVMAGRVTFQKAFMKGDIKMKGDFTLLRNLDQLFPFMT